MMMAGPVVVALVALAALARVWWPPPATLEGGFFFDRCRGCSHCDSSAGLV